MGINPMASSLFAQTAPPAHPHLTTAALRSAPVAAHTDIRAPVLSFGGGVNSTALMLYLTSRNLPFEAVFADLGADWPETYQYLDYLESLGFPITRLEHTGPGGVNIIDYCLSRAIIPTRTRRWCSYKFKIRPIQRYAGPGALMYVGIHAGETRRAVAAMNAPNPLMQHRTFPLIAAGFTQQKCLDFIKAHGITPPGKSACYICPFMELPRIRALTHYPDLWATVTRLEHTCNAARASRGRPPLSIFHRPVEYYLDPLQRAFL